MKNAFFFAKICNYQMNILYLRHVFRISNFRNPFPEVGSFLHQPLFFMLKNLE